MDWDAVPHSMSKSIPAKFKTSDSEKLNNDKLMTEETTSALCNSRILTWCSRLKVPVNNAELEVQQGPSSTIPKEEEHGYTFNQCHFTYVQPPQGASKMLNYGQSWMEQIVKENDMERSNSILQSPRGRPRMDINADLFDHLDLSPSKNRELSFSVSNLPLQSLI